MSTAAEPTAQETSAIAEQREIVEKFLEQNPFLMTACGATDREWFLRVLLAVFMEGRSYQLTMQSRYFVSAPHA